MVAELISQVEKFYPIVWASRLKAASVKTLHRFPNSIGSLGRVFVYPSLFFSLFISVILNSWNEYILNQVSFLWFLAIKDDFYILLYTWYFKLPNKYSATHVFQCILILYKENILQYAVNHFNTLKRDFRLGI